MRKIIFLKLLQKLKQDPNMMRTLKKFIIAGVALFVVVVGLGIWATVAAFNYVSRKADVAMQSPAVQMNVESLKSELGSIPKIQGTNCWNEFQGLLQVQPWAERPAVENFAKLKSACFQVDASCLGPECKKPEATKTEW